ncbi:hypothetical protein AX774_g1129 [Zancudomyces culisetae]|uniref:Uncharacterized protein n=1 Tax=Zancudomyces culisetae TaxID=1213189 RepID=A0A1R1PWR1_ZANCU|nr:hypothetical protein AX774_g1129 [Zancudomyces culisetae]|eukprot:OMH85323.1 hypothetical protein AX774_g1129 [Zancudomyces culisetae]
MFRDKSHEYNSTDGNSEGLKSSITAMLAHQCTNLVLYRNYESLSKFGCYFPNIKYLTLSCSSIIPRRSLKSFELIRRACMNFTHLETLELFDIYEKVQTQALLEIGLNAPKMKRIKLRATYGCNFGLNFENPANLYGLSDNSSDADSDSTFVADTTKTLEKMTPSVINRLNGICQSLGKDTVFSLLHFANPV